MLAFRAPLRLAALAALGLLAACAGDRAKAPPAPPSAAAPEPPVEPPAPPPAPRADILLARARALRAQGDLAGARARLETAIESTPDSDDVRLELAELLVADAREPDRAAELLAGVKAQEGNARWLLAAGQLADLRGDPAGAADAYGRALALGDDPDVRLRRAVALETLGRGGEALAELERVRAARPDDPIVRTRLAERYEAAGRTHEAESEWLALADATPDRPGGWEKLAAFYRRAGRHEAARKAQARADAVAGRHERALRPLLPSKR